MRQIDHGLAAIGLLLLAVALALLLTVGIPISVSRDSIELKDWLGFAGNVLGAFVTLIAAAIAWKAVKKQIGVQRDTKMLDLMTREEDRIEGELHAIEVLQELMSLSFSASAQSVDRPAAHVAALSTLGFSTDEIELRRALHAKVGGPIPPGMLSTVAGLAATIMRTAVHVRRLYIDDNGETPKGVSETARAKARGELALFEAEFQRLYASLLFRRDHLFELQGKLRQRIEAGLVDHES